MTLSIINGAVQVNGRPQMFITADYPYYREYADNWASRLGQLQKMGIHAVTIYIPWRHHQIESQSEPDFNGRSQPNRNVLAFLDLCRQIELPVIAKPGPFIHGETNYGGLPDWVCPLNNPAIEPLLDADGQTVNWNGGRLDESGEKPASWPLPAPFDSEFLRLVRQWMQTVNNSVIAPCQSPHGPIIAMQVGNEGIYSNGQHASWAYDYSRAGLERYQAFLEATYGSLSTYNQLNDTNFTGWSAIPAPRNCQTTITPAVGRQLTDWGRFLSTYISEVFNEWRAPLPAGLPVIANQNPPLDAPYGLDAWLTRVEPEQWQGIHYGFTNWVGDISASPDAFDRYLLAAKRAPGINMEENWGFAELYDPAYVDAATSWYQTLATLNAGATGFNIYTGVGTGHPDTNLEVLPKAPYPDASPITHTGDWTPKAEIAWWLAQFMAVHGAEFLECRPVQCAAWGVYMPHVYISAWAAAANSSYPVQGAQMREFQRQMRALHLDYGIVNLETVTAADLCAFSHLVISGGLFMAHTEQQKLADFISRGGLLTVIGSLPELDDKQQPCHILLSLDEQIRVMANVNMTDCLTGVPAPQLLRGDADVWLRSHPEHDLHFITALVPGTGDVDISLRLPLGDRWLLMEMQGAPAGGALLRMENGRITTAMIKGHNGYRGVSVIPTCTVDGQTIAGTKPGDLFWREGELVQLVV